MTPNSFIPPLPHFVIPQCQNFLGFFLCLLPLSHWEMFISAATPTKVCCPSFTTYRVLRPLSVTQAHHLKLTSFDLTSGESRSELLSFYQHIVCPHILKFYLPTSPVTANCLGDSQTIKKIIPSTVNQCTHWCFLRISKIPCEIEDIYSQFFHFVF